MASKLIFRCSASTSINHFRVKTHGGEQPENWLMGHATIIKEQALEWNGIFQTISSSFCAERARGKKRINNTQHENARHKWRRINYRHGCSSVWSERVTFDQTHLSWLNNSYVLFDTREQYLTIINRHQKFTDNTHSLISRRVVSP